MQPPFTETDASADRLVELRAAVAAIQQDNREHGRPVDAVSGQTSSDWLERAVGAFEGSEPFEEAVQYGEMWRKEEPVAAGDK